MRIVLERRRGELLAAVCDGIGGLPDGAPGQPERRAGLLTAFHKNPQAAPSLPLPAGDRLDGPGRRRADRRRQLDHCSVWVRSGGLYWLSIGDSGLFLLRGGSAAASFRSIITPRS
ncbi:MAG: hypothetical protein ACLU3I_11235 [Acutalibacteraceae bacterium]